MSGTSGRKGPINVAEASASVENEGRLSVWKKRWEENQLRWHKSEVNPYLMNYFENYPSPRMKCFVPLCGKTKDIAYLLSLGHQVFAIEGVQLAIETLNEENSFNLHFDTTTSIYSNDDKSLQIYVGNLFSCPVENWGPFDFIWDRGSLTAVEYSSHERYSELMQRSVSGKGCSNNSLGSPAYLHAFLNHSFSTDTFRYLLVTFDFDKTKWDGKGPRCIDSNDVTRLFGSWAVHTLLSSTPLPPRHVIRSSVGSDSPSFENVYLLTICPKK